jgi:endonuclease YncB( thermonuclease family)
MCLCSLVSLTASAFAHCNVKVGRVVDGDTFYSPTLRVISPTIARTEDTRFRLKDVYAPERGDELFQKARADLHALIGDQFVDVEILTDKDPRGGLIVNVYRCGPDASRILVNEEMRRKGWTSYGRGVGN